MSRRAFTLVELLVVIAIVGLLSTVAVVSLSSARVKARNSRRAADIRQLITAFSQAYDNSGSLPSVSACCVSQSCYGSYSSITANASVDTFLSPYLPTKPVDPSDSNARGYGGYIYIGNWAGGAGFDGTFRAGAVLDFVLEGSVPCPVGGTWAKISARTECIYYVDQ
jgi:prepilin-type N-terminal cleavage/methylation domain-containing protein